MEDCIDKDEPINTNKVKRKLRVIISFRDTCKDFLEKADKAISDLNRMAAGRLLLCLGKLYPYLFTFGMHNHYTVYEHNPSLKRIKIRLLGHNIKEKYFSPLTIHSNKLNTDKGIWMGFNR